MDLNTSEQTRARRRRKGRRKSHSHKQHWVCNFSNIRAAVGAESSSPGATFQHLTRDMNSPPSCKQNTPVYPACAGQGRKPNPNFLMVPINIFLAGWATKSLWWTLLLAEQGWSSRSTVLFPRPCPVSNGVLNWSKNLLQDSFEQKNNPLLSFSKGEQERC